MPTTVLNDQFTGSNGALLSAHVGDSGVTWTPKSVNPGDFTIQTNQIYCTDAGAVIASVAPSTTTYTIDYTVNIKSNASQMNVLFGAVEAAATYYSVVYFSGIWRLLRVIAGSSTQIDSYTSGTGSINPIRIEVAPSSQKVYWDSANNGTYTLIMETTDSAITLPGLIGIQVDATGTTTTGHHLNLITVTENTAPVVDAGADDTVVQGVVWTQSGSFTDDSSSWTATVDYDDGGGVEPLTLTGTTFDLAHTWATPGVYDVVVEVEDDGGLTDTDTVQVTVTDAPTAGVYIVSGVTGTDASAPVVTLT